MLKDPKPLIKQLKIDLKKHCNIMLDPSDAGGQEPKKAPQRKRALGLGRRQPTKVNVPATTSRSAGAPGGEDPNNNKGAGGGSKKPDPPKVSRVRIV